MYQINTLTMLSRHYILCGRKRSKKFIVSISWLLFQIQILYLNVWFNLFVCCSMQVSAVSLTLYPQYINNLLSLMLKSMVMIYTYIKKYKFYFQVIYYIYLRKIIQLRYYKFGQITTNSEGTNIQLFKITYKYCIKTTFHYGYKLVCVKVNNLIQVTVFSITLTRAPVIEFYLMNPMYSIDKESQRLHHSSTYNRHLHNQIIQLLQNKLLDNQCLEYVFQYFMADYYHCVRILTYV